VLGRPARELGQRVASRYGVGDALKCAERYEIVLCEEVGVILDESQRTVARDLVLDLEQLLDRGVIVVRVVAARLTRTMTLKLDGNSAGHTPSRETKADVPD
jgi:hypothetical protein